MKKSASRAAARGMTLIEIMVVIVILGLIATAVAYNAIGFTSKARMSRAKDDVHRIAEAVDTYKMLHGRYPSTEEGVKVLIDEKILKPNNDKGTLLDPWNNEFIYLSPGQAHPDSFDVKSYGADGHAGGDGENADVVSY